MSPASLEHPPALHRLGFTREPSEPASRGWLGAILPGYRALQRVCGASHSSRPIPPHPLVLEVIQQVILQIPVRVEGPGTALDGLLPHDLGGLAVEEETRQRECHPHTG